MCVCVFHTNQYVITHLPPYTNKKCPPGVFSQQDSDSDRCLPSTALVAFLCWFMILFQKSAIFLDRNLFVLFLRWPNCLVIPLMSCPIHQSSPWKKLLVTKQPGKVNRAIRRKRGKTEFPESFASKQVLSWLWPVSSTMSVWSVLMWMLVFVF